MPSNLVKTKRDEKLWDEAKAKASEEYPKVGKDSNKYWAIVNGIYQRMKGKSGDKHAIQSRVILDKADYIKIAQDVVREFFQSDPKDVNLNDIIVKAAFIRNLNDEQIKNICSSSNHLVHASLMQEKSADEDKYIDFDIARPEKIADIIDSMTEIADNIYSNPDSIFVSHPKKEASDGRSYGEFVNNIVRKSELLKQNIRNIATAHAKVANDLLSEVSKTEDQVNKLYRLVRQAVENGGDVEVVQHALGKVFNDSNNFTLIWGDIQTRLLADGLISRPVSDKDRPELINGIENWSPNPQAPLAMAAADIDRRLNKTDELEKTLYGLEKMASDTKSELTRNIVLDKEAQLGAVIKGVGGWIAKKTAKNTGKEVVEGAAKAVAKGTANKAKRGLTSKLMNVAFVGSEAAPSFKKTIKIKGLS